MAAGTGNASGCRAVIVAGGSSTRMGFDKLASAINGISVIRRTAEKFADHAGIDGLLVVAHAAKIEEYAQLLQGVDKLDKVIAGGAQRCHSVWNGLQYTARYEPRLVAVHDAARPLVSLQTITDCLAAAKQSGAAACASRITSTIKRETDDGCVGEHIERDGLWSMETPQVFDFSRLYEAYARAIEMGHLPTDETSVMEWAGEKVKIIETSGINCKVTIPADIELVTALVSLSEKTA